MPMTTTAPTQEIVPATLRALASAAPPCITIVLPHAETRDAHIALKAALTKIHVELEALIPKHEMAALLGPLESAAAELIDSSKEPASFIFLRSPSLCESFRTASVIGEHLAVVGDCFQLRPLLALASQRVEFYILALSLNHTRIMKCTDTRFEYARFPKDAGTEAAGLIPGSTQSEIRAEPVHDRDHPDDQLGHFFREVDRDINALLKDGHPPLVVVGVEHEIAQFLHLTTYPACVKPGIHALPERTGDKEIYQQALALVRSVTTGETHHALENFDKKIGTGHASLDRHQIAEAASSGRIEHLFLREASASSDPGELNTAAIQTLLHGGDIKVLAAINMPGDVPVCAIFRWP
jgi:hypothetical protein